MRDQVFMRRAVVKNFNVGGRLDEDFGMSCERGRAQQATKEKESRDPTRDSDATDYGQKVRRYSTRARAIICAALPCSNACLKEA